MTVLGVTDLTRRHGDRAVVDHVTFDVRAGELLTLVGPSGCGKSTLLRMVCGLEQVDGGTVHIAGRDVTHDRPEIRGVGLVFQDAGLFGHLRVEDNVAFGLRRLPRAERRARVDEVLDMVGLGHAARRYPHELSGGERQRIALARALAPRPRIVLLDEPFANLDEALREDLRRDVVRVLADEGATAILVTHDREEALSLGHRVAVMRDGALVQIDTPDVVFARPHDRSVAALLAPTSFVPRAGGGSTVVRPHDATLHRGGADVVVERSYRGSVSRYTVRRADGSVVLVDSDQAFAPGEPCDLRLPDPDSLPHVP